MYDIHHRHNYNSVTDRVVIAKRLSDLEEAKEARVVSGDLVVYTGTNKVVPSHEWLWEWEKNNPDCYARRAIEDSKQRKN